MIRMLPIAMVFLALLLTTTIMGFSDSQEGLDEKIQIITKKGYQVCSNLKFEDIKAAGVRITQVSWEGFLQNCERLVLQFGNLRVYFDIEARVMFIYSDPTTIGSQEVQYVQF